MSRCLCRRASGDCGRTHRRHSRRVCRRKARRESSGLSRRVCCRRRRLHALVLELRLMRHVLLHSREARRTLASVLIAIDLSACSTSVLALLPAVVSASIAVMSSGLGRRVLGRVVSGAGGRTGRRERSRESSREGSGISRREGSRECRRECSGRCRRVSTSRQWSQLTT